MMDREGADGPVGGFGIPEVQGSPGKTTTTRSRTQSGDDHRPTLVTRTGDAELTTSSAPEPKIRQSR
jgi:hypothetical protein